MPLTLDDLAARVADLKLTLPGTTKVFLPGYNDSGVVLLNEVGTILVKRTDCEVDGEVSRMYVQGEEADEEAVLLARDGD